VILSKFWYRYDFQNFRKRTFLGDDQGELSNPQYLRKFSNPHGRPKEFATVLAVLYYWLKVNNGCWNSHFSMNNLFLIFVLSFKS
jgi:hypothetical protein